MKVLDEKGKLFGKVNLIDLIVVIVLVLVVVAVGWKVAGGKITEAIESNAATVRYEVLCTEIPNEVCEYATTHIGGQLMSNGDLLEGYIVDCVAQPHMIAVADASGNPTQVEDPEFQNLVFTIETQVSEAANAYSVGSQEIRVGKQHIVKTVMLEVTGDIISMEEVTAND